MPETHGLDPRLYISLRHARSTQSPGCRFRVLFVSPGMMPRGDRNTTAMPTWAWYHWVNLGNGNIYCILCLTTIFFNYPLKMHLTTLKIEHINTYNIWTHMFTDWYLMHLLEEIPKLPAQGRSCCVGEGKCLAWNSIVPRLNGVRENIQDTIVSGCIWHTGGSWRFFP